MTRCPRCRSRVTDVLLTCTCGLDLGAVRAELQRLTAPPSTPVLPLSVLRKLPKAARREVAQAIVRAVKSEQPER